VEVLGRYSNLCDQGERIQELLKIVPGERSGVNLRTRKQVQHRLRPEEIDELVRQYQAGAKVADLATDFHIHRDTVSVILNRRGVSRRQRGVPLDLIDKVIASYESGASLATIGAALSVDPATVGRVLRIVGVSVRPRRGWRYTDH
jgi:hypothetical protein